MILTEVPIFPLNTVLLPEAELSLRIFEPRYTDMISRCMKSSSSFGVCLIREGQEAGLASSTYEMGTLADIQDWNMRADGFLGITVRGDKRFKILNEEVKPGQLLVAKIEVFEDDCQIMISRDYEFLFSLFNDLQNQSDIVYSLDKLAKDGGNRLGLALANLLPIKLTQKQYFLQLTNPELRLEGIADLVNQLNLKSAM